MKKVVAPSAEPPQKYELWRPIIQPQRRVVFERIHHRIAEAWSHSMAGYLPGQKRFEFEGLRFDIFSDCNLNQPEGSQVLVFAIDQAQVIGFLMLSGMVARTLVNTRLGIKPSAGNDERPSFTRIESGVAREAIRSLLARLSETYQQVGLGRIGSVRDCERLDDTLMFAPEDYLAMLRFRIGAVADGLRVTVALSSNAINAVRENAQVTAQPRSSEVTRLAGQLPIAVDMVLGAWKTSVGELKQLRPGDQLILPDGEDGWLAADNIRLRKGKIQLVGRTTSIEIKPSVSLR